MNKKWMKLDNAAKIYPLIESDYITSVFRFSATLDINIKKEILLEALSNIMPRFPYYQVTLKTGFFWYYLEENKKDLMVHLDRFVPCRRMIPAENNGYLFKVLYSDHQISVEFHHILGDGTACLIFLNTLIYEYLSLEGYEVSIHEWMKDINSEVDEAEFEDSHSLMGHKHLRTHRKKLNIIKNVFHIKDRLLKRNEYIVTKSIVDSSLLYKTAKKYDCTITEFLTSIYLESIYEIQNEQVLRKKRRKPVAIQVPINMRKRLKSKSMRNFSLFVIPYLIPNKEYSFKEIIYEVKQYITQKTDIDHLLNLMVQNYRTEKTLFVRLLPLMLKNLVTPLIYKATGADTFSGTISNVGRIQLPKSIEAHVKRIDFILGPCPITKSLCSVTGYKENIYITFGRNIKKARVEEKFFRKLVQLGVKVQMEGEK